MTFVKMLIYIQRLTRIFTQKTKFLKVKFLRNTNNHLSLLPVRQIYGFEASAQLKTIKKINKFYI